MSNGGAPGRGPWIRTASGGRFYVLDPDPADVRLEDIAHALSHLCRFTGHTRAFYSVAQHSVLVSEAVEAEDALWGLLHDAAEAYIGDLNRPLKFSLGLEGYREAEQRVERAIALAFNLPPEIPRAVKDADLVLLMTEARDLLGVDDPAAEGWGYAHVTPLPEPIEPWSPATTQARFLSRYQELAGVGHAP